MAERAAGATELLLAWGRGERAAKDALVPLVQDELRRLARHYMAHERANHTLQPTALVNEAYVRLMGQAGDRDFDSRSHFVAIAAQHMRQILVDYARRRLAAKRGGGVTVVSLDDARVASDPRSVDLLALDDALQKLAAVDARKAQAMELKFFGGLEMAEIARVLGVSVKTIEKDVRLGAAWLRSALSAPPAV